MSKSGINFRAQSGYTFTAQHFTIDNVHAKHSQKNYSTIKTTNSSNILTNRRICDNAIMV
jgi:hypothetical protein